MRKVVMQPLLRLCEEQCNLYQRQLALMNGNVMSTSEYRNGVMVDTTAESVARVKEMLAELHELLAEHGKPRRTEA